MEGQCKTIHKGNLRQKHLRSTQCCWITVDCTKSFWPQTDLLHSPLVGAKVWKCKSTDCLPKIKESRLFSSLVLIIVKCLLTRLTAGQCCWEEENYPLNQQQFALDSCGMMSKLFLLWNSSPSMCTAMLLDCSISPLWLWSTLCSTMWSVGDHYHSRRCQEPQQADQNHSITENMSSSACPLHGRYLTVKDDYHLKLSQR